MKDKVLSKKIGEQIRMLRLEKNLSQEALADEFDLSVSTLSNLERGTTEFTVSRLYHFLKYLDANILDFFAKLENIKLPNQFQDYKDEYQSNSKQRDLEEEIRLIKLELEKLKK